MTHFNPRDLTRRDMLRAAAACAAAGAPTLYAQSAWPTKPVTMIVPFPAGGGTDAFARPFSAQFAKQTGRQLIIDNRGGAGGTLGAGIAAKAAPDGYTLFMGAVHHSIAPSMYPKLDYDIEKDFVPVSTTASYGLVITTKVGGAYKNIQDVITAAKAKPGKLNFGSINAGSAQNLSAELFKTLAGLDVTVVPYKTSPDLANAVLRGDVDVAFEYYAGFQASITNDQMVVLATTGPERASNLPNVPTAKESGLPGYEVTSWNGLAVPAGTPAEIVTTLNHAVEEALKSPEVQKYSAAAGMDARGMSSADLHARIKSDVAKWSQVIDKAGIEKR